MTSHASRASVRHAFGLVLIASLVGSAAPASAGTVVSSYKSNGAFASMWASQGDCVWVSMWVARGGAGDETWTHLNYEIYNGCTGEYSYGYGRIANGDFEVGRKTSTLKTNPTDSPEFYTYGQTGRIDVTWTADRSIRWRFDGRWESITPTQRVRQRGKSESYAASARGSITSLEVETTSASVGRNRDMYMEVTR